MPDTVRVLRVMEYVGERDVVEAQIADALRDGTHYLRRGRVQLRIATLGDFPEILHKDT